jgi:hypothetical protein
MLLMHSGFTANRTVERAENCSLLRSWDYLRGHKTTFRLNMKIHLKWHHQKIIQYFAYSIGAYSASWVQLRNCFEEKVAAPVYNTENTAVGDPSRWPRDSPLSGKTATNFAESDGSLVGIVRSRAQVKEFLFYFAYKMFTTNSKNNKYN